MSQRLKRIVTLLIATLWISLSEFARNEVVVKSYWLSHYKSLGLTFPADPLNGAVWGLWSLMLAVAIAAFAEKFSTLQTTLLSWFMAFVMMWVVLGNLGVLPFGLLGAAVPLSLLECYVATLILKKGQMG